MTNDHSATEILDFLNATNHPYQWEWDGNSFCVYGADGGEIAMLEEAEYETGIIVWALWLMIIGTNRLEHFNDWQQFDDAAFAFDAWHRSQFSESVPWLTEGF